MLDDIWVRDCMTRDVVTCAFDTSLEEVAHELQARLFSCLVIVEGKKPTGIITERDLIGLFSKLNDQQDWEHMLVNDHMRKPPKTLYEDLTLMEAVDQMHLDRIRHAPVVNSQQELVGILTQSDVIRGFHKSIRELRQAL